MQISKKNIKIKDVFLDLIFEFISSYIGLLHQLSWSNTQVSKMQQKKFFCWKISLFILFNFE